MGNYSWEPLVLELPKDIELLYDAYNNFYGNDFSRGGVDCPAVKKLKWLYLDNPAGMAFCCLAIDKHCIAGQYITIPINLIKQGRLIHAALSLNTFTHPAYRKQGVFVKLAEALFNYSAESGVDFTIGFPNMNSKHGFLKILNFIEPFPIYLFFKIISPSNKCGLRMRKFFSKCSPGYMFNIMNPHPIIRIDLKSDLDAAWVDHLWQSVRNSKQTSIKKDGAWVRWRYTMNPIFQYKFLIAEDNDRQPLGYIVWNQSEGTVIGLQMFNLIDFQAISLSIRQFLLNAFLNEIAKDIDVVKAISNPFSETANSLLLSGFVPIKRSSFIYRPHTVNTLPDYFLKTNQWNISSAFSDTI